MGLGLDYWGAVISVLVVLVNALVIVSEVD